MELQFLDYIIQKHPKHKIAINDSKQEITYACLNTTVEQIACNLTAIGINENFGVAIIVEKSIKSIILQLSIMRCGAYFIPIDINLPKDRIELILNISSPRLVIYENTNILLQDLQKYNNISVDELYNLKKKKNNLTQKRNKFDVAYCIFTSGSTGKPKGVMISHSSICQYLKRISCFMNYEKDMSTLSIAPICFDVSIHEIYTSLYSGGELFLVDSASTPNEILSHIIKNKITDLIFVPSYLRIISNFLKMHKKEEYANVRRLLFCGETCPANILQDIKEYLPNCELIQGYGPTEFTVGCIFKKCNDLKKAATGNIALGKLLPGLKGCLVKDKTIVQEGIGELYLCGDQLMKGYFNDADNTKKHVVSFQGDVVYKTGDLMYIDSNNEFVFIGRVDDMIKVNGNLVYLSEVEQTLRGFCEIEECHVYAYKNDFDMYRIILFVQKKQANVTENDIIKFLKDKLPIYMIPNKIVFCNFSELPKTPSGKIDFSLLSKEC